MKQMLSIIYAHRNRDTQRIKNSLESLKKQQLQNFEVVFVDYGSGEKLTKQIEKLMEEFPYVHYHHLPVAHLLWNKSKALNYGINKAKGDYIFIADIDLIFLPETTKLLEEIKSPYNFKLFKLGYLEEEESKKITREYKISNSNSIRYGEVNGMILTSRDSLLNVNGLDEFFHFYGAEDEDLFARLETSGHRRELRKEKYFFHQWHQSFSGSEDKLLTGNPRIKNIMRINQRHFHENRRLKVIKPVLQEGMAEKIESRRVEFLKQPANIFRIANIQAHVEHFMGETLPSQIGKVIKVDFYEDPYYHSLKFWMKKKLGRQTQTYMSMKEVNDLILKEILFRYRDHNYSFRIGEDLKVITLSIQL